MLDVGAAEQFVTPLQWTKSVINERTFHQKKCILFNKLLDSIFPCQGILLYLSHVMDVWLWCPSACMIAFYYSSLYMV